MTSQDKITDDELLELEYLLKERDISIYRSKLCVLDEETNPNYALLHNAIKSQEYNKNDELVRGFRGAGLEGSSRSGKTWSGVDIIIWLCLFVEIDGCTINIYRETYN